MTKYKLFPIDWSDYPVTATKHGTTGVEIGAVVPTPEKERYRIYGYTDYHDWLDEKGSYNGYDWETEICDELHNCKYAIGRLE